MHKVSKGFFVGSFALGLGIADVLIIFSYALIRSGSSDSGVYLRVFSCIPMIYGGIVMLVLWYKSWAVIQDGHARTTPGKAIGFCFIPFFNFYWIFQGIWGLSKDFNAYFQRYDLSLKKLPEKLFLSFCILCLAMWIPVLGFMFFIVNYFIGLLIVSGLCDAINTVPVRMVENEHNKQYEPIVVDATFVNNRRIADRLWFFGDHISSFTKQGGASIVVQYSDPDSGGLPAYVTEYVLWRAIESSNYAKCMRQLRKSGNSKFYRDKNILDVKAEFNACYVLRIEENTFGFRDVNKSEKALLFKSAAEVVTFLRDHLDDKLLREILSSAEKKDPTFAGMAA